MKDYLGENSERQGFYEGFGGAIAAVGTIILWIVLCVAALGLVMWFV